MARRLLAALTLAHSAAALLEGFVDVLVKVDIQIPPDAFADLKAAAADDGSDACLAADSVLVDCAMAGYLDATTLSNDAVACICCAGTTPISAVYSSCASYAAEVAAPTAYSSTPSNLLCLGCPVPSLLTVSSRFPSLPCLRSAGRVPHRDVGPGVADGSRRRDYTGGMLADARRLQLLRGWSRLADGSGQGPGVLPLVCSCPRHLLVR